MQHLKLKEEQQRAIEAICHGDNIFVSCLLALVKAYVFMSFLVCREAWPHGWIKNSYVSCLTIKQQLANAAITHIKWTCDVRSAD